MKKMNVILLSVILSAELFGQQTVDLQPSTREDYLKKSKRQDTFATLSLSGGLALYLIGGGVAIANATTDAVREIGGIINPGNPPPPPKDNGTAIAVLLIARTAAVICSISLYTSAAVNKRKAKALDISLKPQKALQFQYYSLTSQLIPSVSLKLNL